MSNKEFYTCLFVPLFIAFVAIYSCIVGMEFMKEEAVINGVGQYNPQTKEFEWIKK